MPAFSAADAVSPAIERTKNLLFRPFRWGTYLKLCVVALLTEGGSGNFNFSSPGGSHHSGDAHSFQPSHFSQDAIFLIVVLTLTFIAIGFAIYYLIVRLRFSLFHCLIHQTTEIRPGWHLYREQAGRYFKLSIVVGLVFLAIVALIALPFVFGFIHLFQNMPPGGSFDFAEFFALFLPLIPVVLVVILAAVAVDLILRDLMLPHIALENASVGAAWAAVRARIAAEKGPFLFYAFLRVLLPLVAMFGLMIVLLIPMIIMVVVVVASATIGMAVAIIVGTVAVLLCLFVLICIGGPINIAIRNYALVFYAARYSLLGEALWPSPPPPAPLPEPGIA